MATAIQEPKHPVPGKPLPRPASARDLRTLAAVFNGKRLRPRETSKSN